MMEAYVYEDGSITYPGHPVGPGGTEPVDTVDLSEYTAQVVTWTTATAPPPGVREPNHLAIVRFDVGEAQIASGNRTESDDEGEPVQALVQLTTDDVEIGDEVEAVPVDELRDPEVGIKSENPESQDWSGYRFEPV